MGYLIKKDWVVESIPHLKAAQVIKSTHYAKGCSNTSSVCFGLFKRKSLKIYGVSMWMNAPCGVSKKYGDGSMKDVLTLSRFVIIDNMPTNSASFLLGQSIKKITSLNKYSCLVTYADMGEGHKGTIYRATNWKYDGTTMGKPKFLDSKGKLVSLFATKYRKKQEMNNYSEQPRTKKHIFFYPLALKAKNHQRQLKLF